MLIGTAGHIDHGKTSLIRRLTGRNTDRLPEEQKRGISIELGYAYVPTEEGEVLGFIDVPGHEKFVHTMLAGATGIDRALLVVAADDGVMPQTEEHLDILRLLGVTAGAIALTKVDAVSAERVAELREQLPAQLGAPAADWPLFEVSNVTGAGIDALDAWLRQQASTQSQRAEDGEFRLAIDRVFTLGGVGTVVTGTVHAGVVRVGDELLVQPRGLRARVRSLHAQDQPAEQGRAGQRCALNLAGLSKDEVARGDWVQGAPLANVTTRFDAVLRLSTRESQPLPQWSNVHLHHGTRDLLARVSVLDDESIEPGDERLVSIAIDLPSSEGLALCRGDRFVLRDASARRTLAGGIVLDIAPPVRGKRRPERLALLEALRDRPGTEALTDWLKTEPVPLARLQSGWNLRADDARRALDAAGARVAAGSAFEAMRWQALRDRTREAVGSTHEREPEMPGLEQNRLRRIVAPALSAEVIADLVDELLREGALVRRGAFLALPSHKAELGKDERVRWEKIKPLIMEQRFDPPRVRDLAKQTGIPEAEVRALMRRVARVGEVTLVALDHFFLTDTVADMADIASELIAAHGAARAAEFRDRIGTGRKVAIQILEFFDRVGFTRRVRDDHLLRRDNPWRAT